MASTTVQHGSADRSMVALLRSRPRNEPSLNLNWVRTQLVQGSSIFGTFRSQCDTADRFYDVRFDVQVPDGVQTTRAPTLRASVNSAMATLMAGHIEINVPPPRADQKAKAEKIERFLTHARDMLDDLFPSDQLLVQHMALYGIAFRKIELNFDAFHEIPEYDPASNKRRGRRSYFKKLDQVIEDNPQNFPFRSSWIDPREMIWDMSSSTPRWMIWTRKVDARWIQAHFPGWRTRNHTGEVEVEFSEIWTQSQVAFFADNEWVMKPRTHSYGMIPIIMFDPGLSRMTKARTPADHYKGVGAGVYEVLEAESRLLTQQMNINSRAAWPNRMVKGPRASAQQVLDDLYNGPGDDIWVPENTEVEETVVNEPPRSLEESRITLREIIEGSLFTDIAGRRVGAGPSSGYQQAVLQGVASLANTAIKRGLERGFQRENELLLRIVENVVGKAISVFGTAMDGGEVVRLSPQEISGSYFTKVKLVALSPDEQERKGQLWSNLWSLQFVDHATALKQMGMPQPSEIILARRAEDLLNDPAIKQALTSLYLSNAPQFAQLLQAAGLGGGAQAGAIEAAGADMLAGLGGAAPNTGQFIPGNSAGNVPAALGSGTPGTAGAVLPGSMADQDRIVRQLSNAAGAGMRIPTGNVPLPV